MHHPEPEHHDEPELNLEGLDSDEDEEIDEDKAKELNDSKAIIEMDKDDRLKLLLRQVENQRKIFGAKFEKKKAMTAKEKRAAAKAAKAAAEANMVSLKKLISLGTSAEKCYLYFGWVCCAIVGATLPCFIFFIGPIFDAFGPDQSEEESLKNVGKLVGVMGGLALIVFITSFVMHHYQTKGAMLITKRI